MSKYNQLKILKKKIANANFRCKLCKRFIMEGDAYYSEEVKNKFIHSLHKKSFCEECVKNFQKQLPPIEDK